MARDKLITIRIESEKRKAFGELAKSQNTDTASLLYDFISGCLSGTLDISLVTGKGNRIDKLDNQIGDDRIDKLETATQRLDERVGSIAKKLNDWVEAFDSRLNDCEKGLSEKITNLEHRLNALSIQLDSQGDRQREAPDIEPVATVETADSVETVTEKVESVYDNVEAVYEDEPDKGSIGPVPGEGDSIEPGKGEGMNAVDADKYLKTKKVNVSDDSLYRWIRQEKIPDSHQGKKVQKYLTLINKLYYPIN